MATKQDPPKKRIKDLLKKAMSSGDRTSASQSYQSMARGAVSSMLPRLKLKVDSTKKVIPSGKAKPNTAKIDSVKKVMPGGGPKPSVTIKKETKIRGTKPIDKAFIKKMQAFDRLPKVEYKPLPKK